MPSANYSYVGNDIYADIVEHAPDPILRFDPDLRAVYINQAVCEAMGLPREELIGRRNRDLPQLPPDLAAHMDCSLRQVFDSGRRLESEETIETAFGSVTFYIQIVPEIVDGRVHSVTAYLRNVNPYKEEALRLSEEARFDPLTVLPNRRSLIERLHSALGGASPDTPVGLLFVDLDDFKPVNEILGHRAGDEVLAAAATRIAHAVRFRDLATRYGGDEFIVLCEHSTAEETWSVARRVLEAVSAPYGVNGDTVTLGACIGLAVFAETVTVQDAISLVDERMRRAKAAGKRTIIAE